MALRIRRMASAVSEAHELGALPGSSDPFEESFTLRWAALTRAALPTPRVARLSERFRRCALAMMAEPVDAEVAEAWLDISAQALALHRALGGTTRSPGVDHSLSESSNVPSVLEVADLAGEVSVSGIKRLHASATSVLDHIDYVLDCPLNAEQLSWLEDIDDGQRMIDVAREAGLSERSLYRRFSDVHRILDVGNTPEALMKARDAGWIEAT